MTRWGHAPRPGSRSCAVCASRNRRTRQPVWICPLPDFRHIFSHPVTSWRLILCRAFGDFDQMVTELGLYGTQDFSDFSGKHDGVELLYHLPGAEFTQVAAIPAGRAFGILAGARRK